VLIAMTPDRIEIDRRRFGSHAFHELNLVFREPSAFRKIPARTASKPDLLTSLAIRAMVKPTQAERMQQQVHLSG
jgi:hypothetical protein